MYLFIFKFKFQNGDFEQTSLKIYKRFMYDDDDGIYWFIIYQKQVDNDDDDDVMAMMMIDDTYRFIIDVPGEQRRGA